MRGDAEPEAPRPRPLSGGLWTLFSWLRRDEQTSSSDSLSSAGSDRTVASFAFLTPAHYRAAATPIVLPSPGPPTDSYKKRVRERNLRRQHDRDLTLHRKYGLYRGDLVCGYDAFSLPPARRAVHNIGDKQDRDRRAVSETLQRRAAYVPGKRRAPSPPGRVSTAGALTTLPQRHSRKRRAPLPPTKFIRISKENLEATQDKSKQMSHNLSTCDDNNEVSSNISMGGKSEKYIKKGNNFDSKSKPEKSFLKQIFENKKRNSAIETSSVRILPSISELDKQAAEIIETCKIKARGNDNDGGRSGTVMEGDRWLCIMCSRFYDGSIKTCSFCFPNKRSSYIAIEQKKSLTTYTQTENKLSSVSSRNESLESDEKQKLKEMLKEMKHSLPKKTKSDNLNKDVTVSGKNVNKIYITSTSSSPEENVKTSETPTLRIGSSKLVEPKNDTTIVPSTSNESAEFSFNRDDQVLCIKNIHKDFKNNPEQSITKSTVENGLKNKKTSGIVIDARNGNPSKYHENLKKPAELSENSDKVKQSGQLVITKENKNLHTPLKISSLLNPIYVPKVNTSVLLQTPIITNINNVSLQTRENSKDILNVGLQNYVQSVNIPTLSDSTNATTVLVKDLTKNNSNDIQNKISQQNVTVPTLNVSLAVNTSTEPAEPNTSQSTNQQKSIAKIEEINQHSKRRALINQLEQSIAKGDERAAAEAATKLAQLRVSCSVLSFTSQILGESTKPSVHDNSKKQSVIETENIKKKLSISTRFTPQASSSHTPNTSKEDSIQMQSTKEKDNACLSKELLNNNNAAATAAPQTESKKSVMERSIPIAILNSEASTSRQVNEKTFISVWIEDKEAARGPVKLRIDRHARLGDLRREAEESLGLQSRLQRWIVGRTLCADDNVPLVSLAGPDLNAPFYLYLVECDTKAKPSTPAKDQISKQNDKISEVYTELMQLERQALVPNADVFECGVCIEDCAPGTGAVLRDCVHSFCRNCLADMIRHCEEPAVPCPAMGCSGVLHEREVRALVTPEDYERWLARGLAAAESGTRNAFHCRTRDCTGWALCDPGVRQFPCPVCKCTNCVPCQTIHEGETCEQHRSKLERAANSDNHTDEGTKALLSSLISRGEALECPQCNAIITKKWGCDWVKCSACKTEICWVTRGRRWGPAGRGDTSGGCRCGVDGKRCHPSCGYCH